MRKWKRELETPSGRMKTSWLQWKDANWSGTGASRDHLDWPRLSYREQFKEETKRQTEETMGRQRQGVNWPWMELQLRKAENRKEWRKLVVKSTVVPQRSARLRDRLLKSSLRMFSLNRFITTSNFILSRWNVCEKNEASRFCFALTLWPQARSRSVKVV